MPSTTVQSRISAFEQLTNGKTYLGGRPVSPSPSPPNLGRRTSLIDLKDWVVDDGPHRDTTRTPTQNRFPSDLINLGNSPPLPTAALKAPPPPLPPRKPSYTSLKSVASSSSALLYPSHTYPPPLDRDSRSSGHVPRSSVSSFHSVSLSSDTDPTTPDSVSNFIATFPMDTDSASLTESYEVLSSSVRPSPATERSISHDWEKALAVPPKLPQRPSPPSLLTSSRASPRSPPPRPPPLPASQPSSPSVRSPTGSLPLPTNTYAVRRAAPPPPPSRSSDRASITSSSSHSHSSHSHSNPLPGHLRRPTPVPPAPRKRYEALFIANVLQVRRAERKKTGENHALLSPGPARGRRAAGWRGLSVDLITGGGPLDANPNSGSDKEDEDPVVGPGTRLEGQAVGLIWARSGLDRARLREIWAECDTSHQGSLDIDAFAKGMWRIDEELRRTQTLAIKSASTASLGSFRSKLGRAAYRPQRQRDLLG